MQVETPSEGHATTIDAGQSLIADGHAMGIAAEIAQHAMGFTKGGLGAATQSRSSKLCTRVGERLGYLLKEIENLGSEDAAEGIDGEEEGIFRM